MWWARFVLISVFLLGCTARSECYWRVLVSDGVWVVCVDLTASTRKGLVCTTPEGKDVPVAVDGIVIEKFCTGGI